MTVKWTAPDATASEADGPLHLSELIHDRYRGRPQNYVTVLGERNFGHKGYRPGHLRERGLFTLLHLGTPERERWTDLLALVAGPLGGPRHIAK